MNFSSFQSFAKESSGRRLIISEGSDIYEHLALENYLLEHHWQVPTLFVYSNSPCVVFGKFQDPWRETNLAYLAQNKIRPARRFSGGGCVYHDEGNLNFSFIAPGRELERANNFNFLINFFSSLKIKIELNQRHDLLYCGKKVSGSAFKQKKDRHLHHLSFLVDTNLEHLRASLQSPIKNWIETRAIASNPSSVINLREGIENISINSILENLMKRTDLFPGGVLRDYFQNINQELPDVQHLQSSAWLWDATPDAMIKNSEGWSLKLRKAKLCEIYFQEKAVWQGSHDLMAQELPQALKAYERILKDVRIPIFS